MRKEHIQREEGERGGKRREQGSITKRLLLSWVSSCPVVRCLG